LLIPVVDSNFLQCEALGVYLAKSSQNFVVLTDYAFMEAYKADTIDTLYRSMDILSRYPKQVIVLKGTQVVCGLSGRNARLQRRLIDARATRGFSKFCSDLLTARHGNVAFQNELLHKARAARDQMHRIGIDAAQFGAALEGITSLFTHEERKVLRTGLPYTEAMGEKMISHVIMSAQSMFMRHPAVSKMPNGAEA
jgi:hypothetical protein